MIHRVAIACGVTLLLLTSCGAVEAQQDGPASYRQLTGSLAVGWLDTTTTSLLAGSTRNPFTSITFDYRDAIIDPAFINYRVQPTFGSGFQDLFGTSSPRKGLSAELSFLPNRPFPLRVNYSRYRRNALVASSQYYGRILTRSDDSVAGIQWQLLVPAWPKLDFSASDSNVETRPEEVLELGYASHSRNVALDASDTRWGWTFDGNVQLQRLEAARLGASESGAVPLDTTTDLRMLRFLGRRDLGRWFSLFLNASGSTTDSMIANGYLRQQYDTYSGRLLFRPSPRLSSWVEARLMNSDLEARSSDISGGPGFVVPRTKTENQIADWEARYEVLRGLHLLGRLEYTKVRTASTGDPEESFDFLNAVGGVQFQRTVGWADLGGWYTLNRYRRNTEGIWESEQFGHSIDANVSVGRATAIRATVGYALSRSRQEVRVTLPYTSDSQRVRAAIEKDFGRGVRVAAHWDLTDTNFDREDLRSDYQGQGYGGALNLGSLSVSYDHGYGAGDSVQQILDPLFVPVGGGSPLFIVGSANEYTTATVSWSVNSALSLRGAWRDQRQAIGALQTSQIEQREAMLRYNFRLIQLEGGYVFYRYDFGSTVFRKSVMLRAVRDFRWF